MNGSFASWKTSRTLSRFSCDGNGARGRVSRRVTPGRGVVPPRSSGCARARTPHSPQGRAPSSSSRASATAELARACRLEAAGPGNRARAARGVRGGRHSSGVAGSWSTQATELRRQASAQGLVSRGAPQCPPPHETADRCSRQGRVRARHGTRSRRAACCPPPWRTSRARSGSPRTQGTRMTFPGSCWIHATTDETCGLDSPAPCRWMSAPSPSCFAKDVSSRHTIETAGESSVAQPSRPQPRPDSLGESFGSAAHEWLKFPAALLHSVPPDWTPHPCR